MCDWADIPVVDSVGRSHWIFFGGNVSQQNVWLIANKINPVAVGADCRDRAATHGSRCADEHHRANSGRRRGLRSHSSCSQIPFFCCFFFVFFLVLLIDSVCQHLVQLCIGKGRKPHKRNLKINQKNKCFANVF